MDQTNLPTAAEILDRFYAAETIYMAASPSERDFSGMAATLAKDMKLYQTPDLPWGGVYEGHSGFLQWSEKMASRFDVLEVADPQVFEGKDGVMVLSTLKFRTRKDGKHWAKPFSQFVRVDREAGVVRLNSLVSMFDMYTKC